MDELKQRWGAKICSIIPLEIWHRLLNIQLVLPHWHVVSAQEIAHVSGIYKFRDIKQFKEDIEFFLRFYTPVSLQDIIKNLEGFGRLPKRCFMPTFDDGFCEVYDIVAPVLSEKGIPAVFFLITSTIDNHELCYPQKKSLLINKLASLADSTTKREVKKILFNAKIDGTDLASQIRNIYYRQRHLLDKLGTLLGYDFNAYVTSERPYLTSLQITHLMKNGFDIGAHSIDHPLYSELTLDEQLVQTLGSMKWLSKKFQYHCQAFAFPYGDTGISQEFFQRSFSDGSLKISFGIGGIKNRYFTKNLSRFSMERTNLPAEWILARQFGRAILRRT